VQHQQQPLAAPVDVATAAELLSRLVRATAAKQLVELESLHARLARIVAAAVMEPRRAAVLQRLGCVVDELEGC
jgi:hypothetical protein